MFAVVREVDGNEQAKLSFSEDLAILKIKYLILEFEVAVQKSGNVRSVSHTQIAYIVSKLDNWITLRRRAALGPSSLRCSRSSISTIRPSLVELAVLTVLAQIYGPVLLQGTQFELILQFIVKRGADVLVQCVLWGETADDMSLASQLQECHEAFGWLCDHWPEAFMKEAHSQLARFR